MIIGQASSRNCHLIHSVCPCFCLSVSSELLLLFLPSTTRPPTAKTAGGSARGGRHDDLAVAAGREVGQHALSRSLTVNALNEGLRKSAVEGQKLSPKGACKSEVV